MLLYIKHFEDLSADELYSILKLRSEVFILEQKSFYQDCDDKDRSALHVWFEDKGAIAAYLRVLYEPGSDTASVGRVIAVKRRCGIGTKILREGIRIISEETNATRITIHAQLYAQKFYETLGFKQDGIPFMDAGIQHVPMTLYLNRTVHSQISDADGNSSSD